MRTPGGAFVAMDTSPDSLFSTQNLTPEHHSIAQAANDFWRQEVEPKLDQIEHKEYGVLLNLFRKSAELGFTGISIPERFGGMELDLPSVMIIEECFARDGSYLVTHGGHAGIGTLPLSMFGSEQQKARYLPHLAGGSMIAAYALSEPQSGSDALAVQTRAELSADGGHYILNGQKMWITNGGIADLFTVFAKVGREKFTAFLVERTFAGVSTGAEEKKMGLRGSSTTAVFFDNVRVPVENVLGEVGRGHVIAFNVLNVGRLKIGPYALGVTKDVLAKCIQYAKQRKAFGKTIFDFGAIRSKLVDMAVSAFVVESMSWRVVGLIQEAAAKSDTDAFVKALEEYSIECSIVKVFASEVVGHVVDEGVQIHGGYGFHQDYAVERYYRDARVFRIFEGTNEINRLLIPTQLLKRAASDRFGLLSRNPDPAAHPVISQAKTITCAALALAKDAFGSELPSHQEALICLADMLIQLFAMESAWLRVQQFTNTTKKDRAADLFDLFVANAALRFNAAARDLYEECGAEPSGLALPRMNVAKKRQSIAAWLLDVEKYSL